MMGHGPGSEWPAQCLPQVLDRMDPTSFMGALASTYGQGLRLFPFRAESLFSRPLV